MGKRERLPRERWFCRSRERRKSFGYLETGKWREDGNFFDVQSSRVTVLDLRLVCSQSFLEVRKIFFTVLLLVSCAVHLKKKARKKGRSRSCIAARLLLFSESPSFPVVPKCLRGPCPHLNRYLEDTMKVGRVVRSGNGLRRSSTLGRPLVEGPSLL